MHKLLIFGIFLVLVSTSQAGLPPRPDMPMYDLTIVPTRQAELTRRLQAFMTRHLARYDHRRTIEWELLFYRAGVVVFPRVAFGLYHDCSPSIEPVFSELGFITNMLPCAWT